MRRRWPWRCVSLASLRWRKSDDSKVWEWTGGEGVAGGQTGYE